MPDQTTETARALLYRYGLPEDVIDGALCLHAQELAAVQRRDAAVWGVDTAAGKRVLATADLIDPTHGATLAAPPLPVSEARTRLLQALDAPYCQALGHTPEGLLAAYEASRTQTVDGAADLAKHVTRSIFALKTPSPDGSKHYQSGWDDGLEAAMDAARDALAAVLPATTNHDTDTSAARPTTLHAIARHLEARADMIFRAESQACTEYHAVAAMLRRVADETAATETGCWCGHSEVRHWTGATDMTFTDGCHDCRGWNGAHVYGQELPWLPGGDQPVAGARQDGAQP